jgi:hypothetical protein
VLVGFFTIFIGVFMVNDAKATSTSLIEKTISRNSYAMGPGMKGPRGEFVPLNEDDQDVQEL